LRTRFFNTQVQSLEDFSIEAMMDLQIADAAGVALGTGQALGVTL
jgi:hypothetical protein